jgi:hypothetical protein
MHTDPERDLPGLQELPLLRLVHGLAPEQMQRLREGEVTAKTQSARGGER